MISRAEGSDPTGEGEMAAGGAPGPADVEYFTAVQSGGWGDTLRSFARFAAISGGARVLDLGTGPGLLPRLLAAGDTRLAVGCDDSWPMLKRAAVLAGTAESQGVARPAWVAGDALSLPFAGEVFDAALATNLLFLLADPSAGLRSLVRVVRRGGGVAYLNPGDGMSAAAAGAFMAARGITGFARYSFVNYGRLAEAHLRLSGQAWCAVAQEAGLEDVRLETRAGGLVVFVAGTKES